MINKHALKQEWHARVINKKKVVFFLNSKKTNPQIFSIKRVCPVSNLMCVFSTIQKEKFKIFNIVYNDS